MTSPSSMCPMCDADYDPVLQLPDCPHLPARPHDALENIGDAGLRAIVGRVADQMVDPGYEKQREAWQREQHRHALEQAVADCRLPGIAKLVLRKEWESTDTYRKLRRGLAEAIKGDRHFLLAWGVKGTGKTIACCRLMLDLAISDKFAATVGRFMSALELGESSDAEEIRELTRIGKASGILVLDDLGQETRNNNRIVNVLTARHNEHVMTFCTMNVSPDRLAYDDRILDRLIERGVAVECSEVVRPGVKPWVSTS